VPSRRQYLATFGLAALWEALNAAYCLALADRCLPVALAVGLCQPFVSFTAAVWWVEQPDRSGRLKLTAAAALGYTLGSAVALLAWK
jgi:hypothetical protein